MPADVEVSEEGPRRIRLFASYRDRSPSELWRDWTEPDRLHSWWGPEASLDLRVGGEYELRWSKIGATLRGKYLG